MHLERELHVVLHRTTLKGTWLHKLWLLKRRHHLEEGYHAITRRRIHWSQVLLVILAEIEVLRLSAYQLRRLCEITRVHGWVARVIHGVVF